MRHLSRVELLLLTLASAAVTANAYYIHPIIAHVARDFGVSASTIGLVPALNQIALALGIVLLLPLGDRFSNRRLVAIFVAGQFCSISIMALASDFKWFVTGSTLLGFFTIAPYMLPAYVSKRVDPKQLGHVTAMLTTGIILGILLARAGSGLVGEYLGWRNVYYIAALLMLAMTIILPLIMTEEESRDQKTDQISYPRLLASLLPIVRQHPEILLSGTIQALNFGLFLAIWLGLGLHLTSPEMGYGVDVVGYLALLSVVNLVVTPWLGRFTDRIGARRARLLYAAIQLMGVCLFYPFGHSLWLLIIPISVCNIFGPSIDVAGRMLFLSQAKEIRTRLTTVYIVFMFVGAGLASWAGTGAYESGGWAANALLAIAISVGIVSLALFSVLKFDPHSRGPM